MKDATRILTRHPDNPLIDPKDFEGFSAIFNPAPAVHDGETILLCSATSFRNVNDGHTRVARSRDGLRFELDDAPLFDLTGREYPFDICCKHPIDPRLTKIDDMWYLITPTACGDFDAPCAILGRTKDFRDYELLDIIAPPRNRGASLFPEKIGGLYYKLDRPGGGDGVKGTIWLSSSPDLIHWGRYRPVIQPYNFWNRIKIGPTPPIKTDRGWLVIIHGVWKPCDGPHYYLGAMLLDLEEPTKVIGKTQSWLLAPERDYETRGRVDNVVFACGALADAEEDELRLYYGAADTRICLATGSLSEVVQACVDEI